ncbi:type II CRISPR-associated endonuclease Cas1 [Lentilactobacillus sp. SPB1-3]|uniref:Type II CRISPR-associated endonuclease Cas1 n=1 Tax=Lentilactobacillus terminaliae TaxID=3003483 RepID=A0ACD5DFD0_9LACO|nr:type II CRISPR-associated endonuclease Cas1 [Lentilactobacillus sp. SPB1-3]MCZ0976633.1 type II CRISPR-associated endonuclease Cas1 [Lentilactobacillus sp. SPB1-3]
MGWRSVIISQHAKMSYSARALVVQTRDGISQIPIDDIDIVLIETTQAVLTAALISKLADHQVKVIFTDSSSEPVCETVGYYPTNRTRQKIISQCNWSEEKMATLWTKIVVHKINNQIKVLEAMNLSTTPLNNSLDKLEFNDITNQEAVVARKYFPILFDKGFSRRSGSTINAALNYGYSIILACINQEIVSNGYLTNLGIHHCSDENQFNLGSDLMEPFRPIVDYWVANQKFNELTPDVKYGLVRLLNLEINFNNRNMLLRNVLTEYVRGCLEYLVSEKKMIKMEMEFINEVPNNAINDNV